MLRFVAGVERISKSCAERKMHMQSENNSQMHQHIHSDAEKKAIINRLSKIIGHVEAIKRMVENDEDCSQVLIQLAAVRSAVNGAGKVVLKNHLSSCIVDAIEENDEESISKLNIAIDKFIK